MSNEKMVDALKQILADNYALYLKTQNYHWNVEGPHFKSLHLLFEDQYKDLFEAIDTIAELIRGLGAKAPGTFETFSKITTIKAGNENASSTQMIQSLMEDQNTISKSLNTALSAAQSESDEVVAGFIIERLTVHRKNAWMLKSSLANA